MLSTGHNTEVSAAAAIAVIVIVIGKDGELKTTACSNGARLLLTTAAPLPCGKLEGQCHRIFQMYKKKPDPNLCVTSVSF